MYDDVRKHLKEELGLRLETSGEAAPAPDASSCPQRRGKVDVRELRKFYKSLSRRERAKIIKKLGLLEGSWWDLAPCGRMIRELGTPGHRRAGMYGLAVHGALGAVLFLLLGGGGGD